MAAYEKLKLSGSTNGLAILVAATATLGTTIHTAHATALDEITLFAHNYSAADVKLTIEYGGVADKDTIEFTVPAEDGLYKILPGLVLTGSVVLTAFAASATAIGIVGHVNRIT